MTNLPQEAKSPRIQGGRVEIIVPTQDGENTYIHPSFGPETYQSVGGQILKAGLYVPTGEYTAPLLHAAYCSESKDEPEFQNVREIMINRWLWVFNRNLWTDKGLYSINDVNAEGRSKPLSANQLEKMLEGGTEIQGVRFSKDNSVRFAPKGSYTLGNHTPKSLAKDGAVIAQYGVRGAELLGEVAATFKNTPYTYGLDIQEGKSPELRVSSLGVGGRLRVNGDGLGGLDSCAFGVVPVTKSL